MNVAVLPMVTCQDWTCWFENHAGTAAWLQGIGTITALVTALVGGLLAWRRYRSDGFVPSLHTEQDRDGGRAAVAIGNDGRSSGRLDAVFVEKGGDLMNPQPAIAVGDEDATIPTELRPGHTLRLLFVGQAGTFHGKDVRVTAQFGARERSARPRRMSRGSRIGVEDYTHTVRQHLPGQEVGTDVESTDGDRVAGDMPLLPSSMGPWESLGRELDVIGAHRRSGRLTWSMALRERVWTVCQWVLSRGPSSPPRPPVV